MKINFERDANGEIISLETIQKKKVFFQTAKELSCKCFMMKNLKS